jgi:hypothetical protein
MDNEETPLKPILGCFVSLLLDLSEGNFPIGSVHPLGPGREFRLLGNLPALYWVD